MAGPYRSRFVPGQGLAAAVASVRPDTSLRDTLELDSLDFEALVVQLSERSGHRIDEDDYQLTTVGSCVDYLVSRAR
jgi:acyl carrier protein